ncbi:tail spike protein, partial [Salmonella enterica]
IANVLKYDPDQYSIEADKKFKYSVKLSEYPTLQDAASAAVDGLLIDVDYHFYNGEKVDFGGKVLTIECKAKFIGDGNLIFTKLGKGSRIAGVFMESTTTPWV